MIANHKSFMPIYRKTAIGEYPTLFSGLCAYVLRHLFLDPYIEGIVSEGILYVEAVTL